MILDPLRTHSSIQPQLVLQVGMKLVPLDPSVQTSLFKRHSHKTRKTSSLYDDSQIHVSASNSIAEDTFFAQGILDQEETDVNSIGVRPPIKTRFSVRQPNLAEINDSDNLSSPNQGVLPLSQTFTVDKGQFPLGMFVTGVRLFVRTAPFNPDTPVFIDLRPCDSTNGNSPSINTVHRFSQVSKSSTDSNLTVNANPMTQAEPCLSSVLQFIYQQELTH